MQIKRKCSHPGCRNVVSRGKCHLHQKRQAPPSDEERPTAARRGYSAKWRKVRLLFLQEHPLCVECEKHGRIRPATVVDHKIPHRGDDELFWDETNWQALCRPCHTRKTRRGE